MSRRATLLLEVWREVGRHLEIVESLERMAPLLFEELPASSLAVRQIDPDRKYIETVAAVGPGLPPLDAATSREPLSTSQLASLLEHCRKSEPLNIETPIVPPQQAGWLPASAVGRFLVAPLASPQGHYGALLLRWNAGAEPSALHEELVAALREPFTVALENDRRLHELVTLRDRVEAENRTLLSKLGRTDSADQVVGQDSGLRSVMARVHLVSRADVPVLILGETGSGKEVVARSIHKNSPRSQGPFLRVNCGAIPPELLDSELFGHEKGSFTGAASLRKGWFERADGGTLFLDECGELPPAAQVRLLRVLQDGVFERVGGERPLRVDVRVIAATHRDLRSMVAQRTFREDLWYRLAVFPIELPPLRDRAEDIPELARHFALRAAHKLGLRPCLPDQDQILLLTQYPWPGNVRELANVMERACILGDGEHLAVAAALGPQSSRDAAPASPTREERQGAAVITRFPSLDQVMSSHIEAALQHAHGRIEGPHGAARLLGINPHTLRSRMRKMSIAWREFRPSRPLDETPL